MLIGASIASMVFGLFAAYGILRVGFAMMRRPEKPVAVKTQREPAGVL